MKSRITPLLLAAGVFVFVLAPSRSSGQAAPPPHPARVIGSERCEECHKKELLAWKSSTHSRSNNIHRDAKTKERAKEIAIRMGIRSVNDIPSHPLCTECHFTRQRVGNIDKVIGAVSCESCHGGAKDFRDVHGNKDKIPDRAERQKLSKAAGMLYPHEIQRVAENCYACHIVRDEKLVNVGGHKARSEAFNLVDWTAGEVRHNFFGADHGRLDRNLETPVERRRLFHLVGMLLDLEHSLRGLAASRGKADRAAKNFRYVMGSSVQTMLSKERLPKVIAALGGEAGAPEPLLEIQRIGMATDLKGKPEDILKAADAIKAQIEAFGKSQDGTALGALDALLPKKPKGTPYQP